MNNSNCLENEEVRNLIAIYKKVKEDWQYFYDFEGKEILGKISEIIKEMNEVEALIVEDAQEYEGILRELQANTQELLAKCKNFDF